MSMSKKNWNSEIKKVSLKFKKRKIKKKYKLKELLQRKFAKILIKVIKVRIFRTMMMIRKKFKLFLFFEFY